MSSMECSGTHHFICIVVIFVSDAESTSTVALARSYTHDGMAGLDFSEQVYLFKLQRTKAEELGHVLS